MARLETSLAFPPNFFAHSSSYSAAMQAIIRFIVATHLQASIYEKRNLQGEVVVEMVLLRSKLAARQGCLPQLFVISTAQTMPRPKLQGTITLEADRKMHTSWKSKLQVGIASAISTSSPTELTQSSFPFGFSITSHEDGKRK